MKKLLLIIIMFFSFTNKVIAKEELLINNLKINNAQISPEFDKYNNYYSVTIENNINSLEFEMVYNQEMFEVKIDNNESLVKNKLVYVSIFDKKTKEQNTYIFKIYIENKEISVNEITNDMHEVKINSNDNNYNYAPVIGTICFAIIIIIFKIMFL